MATKYSSSPERRHNRLNGRFWREAFLAYEMPAALRQGMKVTPTGLAHLSAEFADAALLELRRRRFK